MNAVCYRCVTVAVALIAVAGPAAAGEESLEDAKQLYANAAFENALAVLGKLDAETDTSHDILEYKAFCLIALGRLQDAQGVIEALVRKAPGFVPTDEDVSPRFTVLLNETRRRLLPDVTRQLFNDAREQFRAKNTVAAKKQFEEVLRLTDDDAWGDRTEGEDLRTLASGFLDLVNATVKPADVASSTPAAVIPSVAAGFETRQRVDLRPPVPVEQVMPKWRPVDAVTAQRRFTGAVRLRIGADGRVLSAAIEVPTDPEYDKQLLEAVKSWRYTPGSRDGQPIEMEKLVTFSLRVR